MSDQRRYPAATVRPKVLYIGGTGRTGSTLLTRLLGEIPGWFAAGELAFLWKYGLAAGGRCSCGKPLPDCEVWAAALDAMRASGTPVDAARMVALRRRCWSAHLPLMAIPGMADRCLDRLEEFPSVVESLYGSLADVTASRVIIDSSKEPHYSWILRDRTDLDVYFLHLVRDPRAVAYSWRRRRSERGFAGTGQSAQPEMDTRSPIESAAYFAISNTAADRLWLTSSRYRLLRYEDFVADPATALADIADFLNEPVDASPLRGRTFTASKLHLAWGNPNRFDGGEMTIRTDEAWRRNPPSRQERWQERLVMGLTAAHRYGYALDRSGDVRPVQTERRRQTQIAVPATEIRDGQP